MLLVYHVSTPESVVLGCNSKTASLRVFLWVRTIEKLGLQMFWNYSQALPIREGCMLNCFVSRGRTEGRGVPMGYFGETCVFE